MNTKLKPVTFVSGRYTHNRQNTSQQFMLLKALQVTQDPKKLRQMINVRTVADVYRTLDKLALRKEYHEALSRNGLDFDSILATLKNVMDGGEKDGDRVKAAQIILKSLGLDKYEDSSIGGGSWEDEILKASENKTNLLQSGDKPREYEVIFPEIPESVKKKSAKEKEVGRSLYE